MARTAGHFKNNTNNTGAADRGRRGAGRRRDGQASGRQVLTVFEMGLYGPMKTSPQVSQVSKYIIFGGDPVPIHPTATVNNPLRPSGELFGKKFILSLFFILNCSKVINDIEYFIFENS
jgi:hypothetical protein